MVVRPCPGAAPLSPFANSDRPPPALVVPQAAARWVDRERRPLPTRTITVRSTTLTPGESHQPPSLPPWHGRQGCRTLGGTPQCTRPRIQSRATISDGALQG